MDLKSDCSGRGWLHIDPGQSESGSKLTTSADVGRIQGVRWKGPQPVGLCQACLHCALQECAFRKHTTVLFDGWSFLVRPG